jgi:ERCC4-type nuclease
MIIIDSAEPSEIKERLREMLGDEAKVQAIPIGDYAIFGEEKDALITRKTYPDMVKSARVGHLWSELNRMADSEVERQALILEGDPYGGYEYGHFTFPEVCGIMLAVALEYGLPIIPSRNVSQTANILAQLNKKLGKGKVDRHFKVRHLPKIREEDIPVFIVQGIKNIGAAKAKSLLGVFGTPLNIFNADIDELREVDGIGRKMATQIHNSVRQKYVSKKAKE